MYRQVGALFAAIVFSSSAVATTVKMSNSGICHDSSSPWYEKTTNYVPFNRLDACLNEGGRLPKGYKGNVDQRTSSTDPTPYKRKYCIRR